MNKKTILVVSADASDSNLNRWASMPHPFHVNVVTSDEQAIECCHLQQFDLVVIDNTDSQIDSKKLRAVLPILQDKIVMIPYDGESAVNISENIEAIINAQKYKRILNMILPEPGEKTGNMPQFSLN